MARQYITCTFPNSTRLYTFHYDGEEKFAPGETVEAETQHGISTVTVQEVGIAQPTFNTRSILGRSNEQG